MTEPTAFMTTPPGDADRDYTAISEVELLGA